MHSNLMEFFFTAFCLRSGIPKMSLGVTRYRTPEGGASTIPNVGSRGNGGTTADFFDPQAQWLRQAKPQRVWGIHRLPHSQRPLSIRILEGLSSRWLRPSGSPMALTKNDPDCTRKLMKTKGT